MYHDTSQSPDLLRCKCWTGNSRPCARSLARVCLGSRGILLQSGNANPARPRHKARIPWHLPSAANQDYTLSTQWHCHCAAAQEGTECTLHDRPSSLCLQHSWCTS